MLRKPGALLMLLIALATAGAAQQPAQKKTWAVVIGVSKYQKLPGGQQLQFADRDAVAVAEALGKRGVSPLNVRLLIGAEATTAAIKSAIGNWLAKSASGPDTVIIFFSGHGFFERDFGESYLLGYDSDPKDAYGSALSVSEIGQALSHRGRSDHVLLIADALRRDFFDPESDPGSAKSFERTIDQLTASRPGLSAMVASGPGEYSREGQRWGGHGAFTRHFVDSLIEGVDRNGDGTITAGEIFDSVTARLAQDTSNKQHPWRSGSALAQISIAPIERPSAPSATAVRSEPLAKSTSASVTVRAKSEEPKKPNEPADKIGQNTASSKPAGARADAASSPNNRKVEPTTVAVENTAERRVQPGAVGVGEKSIDPTSASAGARPSGAVPAAKSGVGSRNVSGSTAPAPPPPSTSPLKRPPGTEAINSGLPASGDPGRTEVGIAKIPPAPKPVVNPPRAVLISSDHETVQPEAVLSTVPGPRVETAPSPLVLQVEAAIASRNLIEPKNNCAWDFYQQLASDPGSAADLARLRPRLAQALAAQGRSIVGGDVRSDNISERVDDFKRAGQLLSRSRSLAPQNSEAIVLEKLSAAEALISLQFFDEAGRALSQLQSAKLAAVENAFGLVYQGTLDTWQAERGFKKAIELDSKWAAPHYNLALLYRGQKNQLSLAEFEAAAALDPNNVTIAAALGEEYFARQQWKQAADAFRRTVALKPSDDTLHTKLGHALYSQGLQEEANREYQKARELRGRQP
jgi:tetratricopeptide (TPR) repeat protein